jgi:hypothetical protein
MERYVLHVKKEHSIQTVEVVLIALFALMEPFAALPQLFHINALSIPTVALGCVNQPAAHNFQRHWLDQGLFGIASALLGLLWSKVYVLSVLTAHILQQGQLVDVIYVPQTAIHPVQEPL